MYSSLLSPQDFARLSDTPDLPTLITQLKQTAYGPYLESLKEKDLTPQKVDLAIKGRLADPTGVSSRWLPCMPAPF